MARIDLEPGVWIPEPVEGPVLTAVRQTSVVERLARKVNMTALTAFVRRYIDSGVDVVEEAQEIPETSPELGQVLLTAVKFANRFRISEEDLNDSLPGLLDQFKAGWASSFARKLDNAALGVTVEGDLTDTAPFNSVYYEVANNGAGVVTTGGALGFEAVSEGLGALETGDYFDPTRLVVIAHPAFRGDLRNLKDEDGNRVVSEPTAAGSDGSIFGYNIVYSVGARTSDSATERPNGNPLLIVGNADHLILGQRSGPESQVSDIPNWKTDEPELKMRARRGFAVANPDAFVVIERTDA
jgi:HK97 family phage major capsid protein